MRIKEITLILGILLLNSFNGCLDTEEQMEIKSSLPTLIEGVEEKLIELDPDFHKVLENYTTPEDVEETYKVEYSNSELNIPVVLIQLIKYESCQACQLGFKRMVDYFTLKDNVIELTISSMSDGKVKKIGNDCWGGRVSIMYIIIFRVANVLAMINSYYNLGSLLTIYCALLLEKNMSSALS